MYSLPSMSHHFLYSPGMRRPCTDPGQQLTHLFILNLESGQPGLQLVVPHKQLRLDRLLCTDLADLQKETLSLQMRGARVGALINIPSRAQDTGPVRPSDLPWVTRVGHSKDSTRWELGSSYSSIYPLAVASVVLQSPSSTFAQ